MSPQNYSEKITETANYGKADGALIMSLLPISALALMWLLLLTPNEGSREARFVMWFGAVSWLVIYVIHLVT
jgi:hypothetical protein